MNSTKNENSDYKNAVLRVEITHKMTQLIALYEEFSDLIDYVVVHGYKIPDEAWYLYHLLECYQM